MTHPKNIRIEDFDYQLPQSSIAAYPKEKRDESRLLVFNNATIKEDIFRNISSYLPQQSLMVLNNTRVVEARILFRKPSGAQIEIFCLEPDDQYPDISSALAQTGTVIWKCMVGRSGSWPHNTVLTRELTGGPTLCAKIIFKKEDHFLVQLSWIPEELSFADILHLAGSTPLPPYIKRKAVASDAERYQTVYAHQPGSVAAPTAGLHFTAAVIQSLHEGNIKTDYVTLHVGAGTFKPVKSNTMSEHDMHAEFIEVKKSLIETLLDHADAHIIAVGTTSLRTLESLYWIGAKIYSNPNVKPEDLEVHQWDAYDHIEPVSTSAALQSLIGWMSHKSVQTLVTKTSLLIAPPYKFRIANILITNFHQPRSTLLLLVAAFIGKKWKDIYRYALENQFRFLSYGDSCLLFRQ
jgi:S-adenosylmethionine:tRNA ribosyltransferase-isomerase